MVLFFEDGDGEAHVHECAGTADYLEDAAADGGDDLLDQPLLLCDHLSICAHETALGSALPFLEHYVLLLPKGLKLHEGKA